jgi:hypothetical protein
MRVLLSEYRTIVLYSDYKRLHELVKRGAFQNGGENLRRPYRAQEKIDFWRWGFAPPPKINQRKAFS